MIQGKTLIIVLVTLVIGFGAGFVLRPAILPPSPATIANARPIMPPAPMVARGKPYFAAHLDEARRIVAGCAAGSAQGDECANAEQAVTEAEGQSRLKRFLGKRD